MADCRTRGVAARGGFDRVGLGKVSPGDAMSTAYTRRAVIVVAASDRDAANADALAYDPVGGDETFRVGLSPTGSLPITHYWASTACREAVWQAFVAAEATQVTLGVDRTRWLFDGLTVTPDDALASLGLQRLMVVD